MLPVFGEVGQDLIECATCILRQGGLGDDFVQQVAWALPSHIEKLKWRIGAALTKLANIAWAAQYCLVYVQPTLIDLDVIPDVYTYDDVVEFASCDVEPVDVQSSLEDADVNMEMEFDKDLNDIWGSDIDLLLNSCVYNPMHASLEIVCETQRLQVAVEDISGITTCASVDTIVDRDHDRDVHERVPLECDICPSINASQVECMGGQATGVYASRVCSYGLCRERVPLAVSPLGKVHGSVALAEDASVRVVPVLGARRIFDPGGYSCIQ